METVGQDANKMSIYINSVCNAGLFIDDVTIDVVNEFKFKDFQTQTYGYFNVGCFI